MYKVSMVLPVYNVRDYIISCLESIEAQDCVDDIEVLVVDDGCPDDSVELVRKYMESSALHIVVIEQENSGLGMARNTGIENASGEYIWFIDTDDTIAANCVGRLYDYAHDNELDILTFDMTDVDEHGNVIFVEAGADEDMAGRIMDREEATRLFVHVQSPTNRLYRTELWKESGIRYDSIRCFEDLATIPKILSVGSRFGYIHESFYNYLQRGSSLLHKSDADKFGLIIDVTKDLDEYFADRADLHDEIEMMLIENAYLMTTVRLFKTGDGRGYVEKLRSYILSSHPDYHSNPYIGRLKPVHRVYLWFVDRGWLAFVELMVKMFF